MMLKKTKLLFVLLILLTLHACTSQGPGYKGYKQPRPGEPADLQLLLQSARQASSPQREAYLLDAVSLLRNENNIQQAFNVLEQIPFPALPIAQKGRFLIEYSELNLKTQDGENVLDALAGDSFKLNKFYDQLPLETQVVLGELRGRAYAATGKYLESVKEYLFITPLIPKNEIEDHYITIWDNLNNLSTSYLEEQIKASAPNEQRSELKGWLELAYLNRAYQYDINTQLRYLKSWLQTWGLHPAATYLPSSLSLLLKYADQRPGKIAVLLPFSGKLAASANIIRDGIIASHYAAKTSDNRAPALTFFNTAASDFISVYQAAVESGAELIIGPLSKENVTLLQQMNSLPVETLALNQGDPQLGSPKRLYQFGLSPEDEVIQVVNRAWEDGHVNAAVLFPDNEWGYRMANKFEQVWLKHNGKLVSATPYSPKGNYKTAIKTMLNVQYSESRAKSLRRITGLPLLAEFIPRRREDVDFIFMVAFPTQARQLKPTLLHADAKDLPVYSTSGVYDQEGDKNGKNDDLNGLYFCDIPWLLLDDDEIKIISKPVWPNMSTRGSRLFALGIDAYRLQGRLAILEAAPETRIHGATGSLSLDENRKIRREMIWAEIKRGRLKELPLFYGDLSE